MAPPANAAGGGTDNHGKIGMAIMKRLLLAWVVALGACLWTSLPPAAAQDDPASEIALPGLQSDADAFAAQLKQAFPAGATDDQKAQAQDAVRAALAAGD